jgi:hypothetical protein
MATNGAPDSWDDEGDQQQQQLASQLKSLNVNAPAFVPNVNAAVFVPSFLVKSEPVPQAEVPYSAGYIAF